MPGMSTGETTKNWQLAHILGAQGKVTKQQSWPPSASQGSARWEGRGSLVLKLLEMWRQEEERNAVIDCYKGSAARSAFRKLKSLPGPLLVTDAGQERVNRQPLRSLILNSPL